jgi:hypothetical protein
VATPERRYGGITVGGIMVIVGIVLVIVWSFWIGLIVALIGLVAFGASYGGSGISSAWLPHADDRGTGACGMP